MVNGDTEAARSDSVVDHTALLERFEGDRELLREIASLFLEDVPQRLSELRDAVSRRDSTAVQRAAHTIKGAVSILSAAAAEAALRVEMIGRAGDVNAAGEACAALEQEIARVTQVLLALA